jgi:hypothetical protein
VSVWSSGYPKLAEDVPDVLLDGPFSRPRASAIAALEGPAAISSTTSRSRAVRLGDGCRLDGGVHEDLPLRIHANAARISCANSSGSSQAAKCPALAASL